MRKFLLVLTAFCLSQSAFAIGGFDFNNVKTPRDFPKAKAVATMDKNQVVLQNSKAIKAFAAGKMGLTTTAVTVTNVIKGSTATYLVVANDVCTFEVTALGNRKYSINRSSWTCAN